MKKDPNNIRALLEKASLYSVMPNKARKAKEFVAKAHELDPDNPAILTMLAQFSLRHKYDEANLRAMKLVDKALEIDPLLDGAWRVKGLAYDQLKDMEGICY